MSSGHKEESISLELARRDIEDIDALRKSDPFIRYFIRRLKQRRDKFHQTQYADEKIMLDEREKMRRIAREYDDLLEMMNKDYTSAQRTVDDKNQAAAFAPFDSSSS